MQDLTELRIENVTSTALKCVEAAYSTRQDEKDTDRYNCEREKQAHDVEQSLRCLLY